MSVGGLKLALIVGVAPPELVDGHRLVAFALRVPQDGRLDRLDRFVAERFDPALAPVVSIEGDALLLR